MNAEPAVNTSAMVSPTTRPRYLVFKNGEKEKKNELDVYLQESHYKLFKALTNNLFGTLLNIDNKKARGLITRVFEKLYQNIE